LNVHVSFVCMFRDLEEMYRQVPKQLQRRQQRSAATRR